MCDSEFQVMKVIWSKGEVTSREVIDILSNKMNWSSSTIKTLLSRLLEKKYISKIQKSNKYIYYSNCNEENIIEEMINNLMNNICNKKKGKFISYMLKKYDLSIYDIRNIKEILDNKKNIYEDIKCNCIKGQCNCKE